MLTCVLMHLFLVVVGCCWLLLVVVVVLSLHTSPPHTFLHTHLFPHTGQSLYGGRVDNEFDQRLLDSFVKRLFCSASFGSNFQLAEGIQGPEGTKRNQFVEWIEALPSKNSPTWLGLPETAEDMLLANIGVSTLRKLSTMQDRKEEEEEGGEEGGEEGEEGEKGERQENTARRRSYAATGGGTTPGWMARLSTTGQTWLSLLPETMHALKRSNDEEEDGGPLVRCFDREIGVGQTLLAVVRNDLTRYGWGWCACCGGGGGCVCACRLLCWL